MISRRTAIKGMFGTAGFASLGLSPLSSLAANTPTSNPLSPTKLKRVVFFLQNQGFDPLTCIPAGIKESCDLDTIKLAEPMRALEPLKHKMQVIMGLHGTHTTPQHSACFGALGGYRGGMGQPPSGATIDHILSQKLPQTVMPHLSVGMDSLDNMKARPTLAKLSASGAGRPIFMESDPNSLYQKIFGSVSGGNVRRGYQAKSSILEQVEEMVSNGLKILPDRESERFAAYVDGFSDINGLRERLADIPEVLKRYAPKYDERFTRPEFETDWHNATLDVSIAAMQANLSNVLTIGSGRGEVFGSWKGLGISQQGHSLGHMKQPGNDIWVKIRQYNSDMLLKLINALEATPEPSGDGSMMDNTLIVYTSNNAEKQHTKGEAWPFVLIGDGGGYFKTNRLTFVEGKRPINDLYTTLLRATGVHVDRFNVGGPAARAINSQIGPIEEILA